METYGPLKLEPAVADKPYGTFQDISDQSRTESEKKKERKTCFFLTFTTMVSSGGAQISLLE